MLKGHSAIKKHGKREDIQANSGLELADQQPSGGGPRLQTKFSIGKSGFSREEKVHALEGLRPPKD